MRPGRTGNPTTRFIRRDSCRSIARPHEACLEACMSTRGYFLSPAGELELIASSHIAAVIATPERFGLTTAEIAEAHRRHGEALGTEWKARTELLVQVLRTTAWVRIRERRPSGWTLQLDLEQTDAWARVQHFARLALQGGAPGMAAACWPNEPAVVLDPRGVQVWTGTLAALSQASAPVGKSPVRRQMELLETPDGLCVERPSSWGGGLARAAWIRSCLGVDAHIVSPDRWRALSETYPRRWLVERQDGTWQLLVEAP